LERRKKFIRLRRGGGFLGSAEKKFVRLIREVFFGKAKKVFFQEGTGKNFFSLRREGGFSLRKGWKEVYPTNTGSFFWKGEKSLSASGGEGVFWEALKRSLSDSGNAHFSLGRYWKEISPPKARKKFFFGKALERSLSASGGAHFSLGRYWKEISPPKAGRAASYDITEQKVASANLRAPAKRCA
jgi:hypothetical protein